MHTVNFMLNNIEHNINEIKEKEIFLQNLIDALPDAVRIIDEDYNIVLANKAYDGYIKNNICSNRQNVTGHTTAKPNALAVPAFIFVR